jgi:hypothetical protein
MVEHLAQGHGKKRIAYISGPKASVEAEERLAAYQEGLRSARLSYDPSFVYIGNFWYDGGEAAVREFLDARKIPFDAIVAANDYMALGALRELGRRGVKVPEDVAIVGYDDILEAECENPPLSTVRQPLTLQADEAFKLLLGLDARKERPALETKLVLRRSCGCEPLNLELAGQGELGSGPNGIPKAEDLLAKAAKAAGFKDVSDRGLGALSRSCVGGIESGSFDEFFRDAETEIYRGGDRGEDLSAWQNFFSVLRLHALRGLSSPAGAVSLENAIGRIRILIGTLEINRLRMRRSKDAAFSETLGVALKAVGKAETLTDLGAILRDQMRSIGLRSFYFAVKADIAPGCGPVLADAADFVLYAALCDGVDALAERGPRTYPAKDFLPAELLPKRPFNFIAMPVSFGLDFYGVAVYEPGPVDGSTYTRINDQVGTAVQSALLIEAGRKAEKLIEARSEKIVSLARPISVSVVEASRIAQEEAAKVEALGESARRTRSDIANAEKTIQNMAERARAIKEFAKVIEDISSTISLLGLNAAIEAARAGKMGRGFNVIATEIRKLAESTHANVESIGKTLVLLSTDAESSVAAVKRSSQAFSSLDTELGKVMSALKDMSSRMVSLSDSSEELIRSM